jgi:hypothetical protein
MSSPPPSGLLEREGTRVRPLALDLGLDLLWLDGVQPDARLHLRRVALVALAPVVRHSCREQRVRVVKGEGGDRSRREVGRLTRRGHGIEGCKRGCGKSEGSAA